VAIIVIALNTDNGDTLQDVVDAILADISAPQKTPADNPDMSGRAPFTEQNVINGTAGKVVKVDLGEPSEQVRTLVKTLQDTNQSSLLGPMDGDRKRGEAGPGHRRRTNKQIEEDEAYFKQRGHDAIATMESGVEDPKTRAPTSDPLSQGSVSSTTKPSNESASESLISSGDDRTNPEDDTQDAADEAAETASHKGGEPTLDDLRQVIGLYQKKFGMAQAAAKMTEYIGCSIFEVPSKDIPLVIARWQAAIEHDKKEDGAKFSPVASGVDQTTHAKKVTIATREEVNAAINDYATKFDGSLEPAKMVHTKTDIPKLMERLFGAGKNNFNAIERTPENYGRVIAAIQAEINKNTFGRAAK
jgi:hypothetical protein